MLWWLQLITVHHGTCAEAVIRNTSHSRPVFQRVVESQPAEQEPRWTTAEVTINAQASARASWHTHTTHCLWGTSGKNIKPEPDQISRSKNQLTGTKGKDLWTDTMESNLSSTLWETHGASDLSFSARKRQRVRWSGPVRRGDRDTPTNLCLHLSWPLTQITTPKKNSCDREIHTLTGRLMIVENYY